MRFDRPKAFSEGHLIGGTNRLIAEEYHQVVVESLPDLGKDIVI
jgi:hypothetical protein